MGIEQINAAVLAGSIEGLLGRSGESLDAFERGYLLVVVGRLRGEGDRIVAEMPTRERAYFRDLLHKAYQKGLIDDNNIVAQELGLARAISDSERQRMLDRIEERRRALEELSEMAAKSGARHSVLSTVDEEYEAALSAPEALVYQLKRSLIAHLYDDHFSARNALKKYDRAYAELDEKHIAYLQVLAIHELLSGLPEHLSDPVAILNNPEAKSQERLQDFLSYVRALTKFSEIQARILAEAVEKLPDPDAQNRRK